MKDSIFDNFGRGDSDIASPQVIPIFTEVDANEEFDEETSAQDIETNIPILALRNMVMFPGMAMPVSVGRQKSLALIREAQRKKLTIGVVCQIDSSVEDPDANDLYQMGTTADIIKVIDMQDNTTNVFLRGHKPFILHKITSKKPYLKGDVTIIDQFLPQKGDKEFAALISSIKDITYEMFENLGRQRKGTKVCCQQHRQPVVPRRLSGDQHTL